MPFDRTQIEKELSKLNILKVDRLIIPIKNTLDKYLSNHYSRGVINTYTFSDTWSYKNLYDNVFNISSKSIFLFHSTDLSEISRELKLPINHRNNANNQAEFLNEAHAINKDVVEAYSMDEINDEFKIHCLLSDKLDNVEKKWRYKGNFDGDEFYINSNEFGIYSEIEVKATNSNLEFYKYIFSEAYFLSQQLNYKLANFLLYTAIENFFSQYFKKGRLKQLIENFEKKYQTENLKYFKKIKEFEKQYCDARKGIAHGNVHFYVTEREFTINIITILRAINEISGIRV